MSIVEWGCDFVEKPFCRQLAAMGGQWIEGAPDLPESTARTNSREVLLRGGLAAKLREINVRDGQPWLDDARVESAIHGLERTPWLACIRPAPLWSR